MNIIGIIQELKQYEIKNEKNNNKNVYRTIQNSFLDGYIGVIMNQIHNDDSYEVYLYIKEKENIVSPLLLRRFKDVFSAVNYFDELVYLIENNTEEVIIERCKITV